MFQKMLWQSGPTIYSSIIATSLICSIAAFLPFAVFSFFSNCNANSTSRWSFSAQRIIPYLFNYNQICVLSNGMETRLGSFAAGYEFFFEWLKVANEKENPDRKAMPKQFTSLWLILLT